MDEREKGWGSGERWGIGWVGQRWQVGFLGGHGIGWGLGITVRLSPAPSRSFSFAESVRTTTPYPIHVVRGWKGRAREAPKPATQKASNLWSCWLFGLMVAWLGRPSGQWVGSRR